MYLNTFAASSWQTRKRRAFTLAEVVMAVAIIALVFSTVLIANTQATRRAEWTGYSLAAQSLAIQQLEQARSALWDPATYPPKVEITNLVLQGLSSFSNGISGYTTTNLDLPVSGTNYVYATNYVSVNYITVSSAPVINVYMVRVDTVWPWVESGGYHFFTNTVVNYYAPDNPESL